MRVAFYRYRKPGIAGLFARFTRFITGGTYSHCELIFANGQAYSASIQDGGTRWKRIEFDPEKWDILEVPVDERRARQFCNAEEGCLYDFQGICRFLFPWVRESKTRWFCSEIVTAGLQAAGLLKGIPAHLVHPTLLYWLLICTGARRVNG